MGEHQHAHHGAAAAVHMSRKDYLIGFALSAGLTAIPFWLIMSHALTGGAVTALVIMGFAAVQVVVQMVYFLHMNSRSEGGWSLLALLFTALIVGIVIIGSLWVMNHLDTNMMPMTAQAARLAP